MGEWSRFRDHLGKRYGRLLVIAKEESTKAGAARWRVRCDCGTEKVIQGRALTYTYEPSNHRPLRSCGCLRREQRMLGRNPKGQLVAGWSPKGCGE